ncbi:hypothetical protein EDD11_009542 [Mortierella claussenii]|nr:hypothetical protein EDD11_009542 [Mortierella claussenii]
MSNRPQRPQRASVLQEYTFPGMAAAPIGYQGTKPSKRHSKATSSDSQSIGTRPLGANGLRARSDSMPTRNSEAPGAFADDPLREISSKITKDPTSRNRDIQYDENSHLRAPLNSRMASKSNLDTDKLSKHGEPLKAGSLSLKMQESVIIEDLLFIMMGIEGKYIVEMQASIATQDEDAGYIHKEFSTDESLDPSLRDLVSRILPLASTYLSLEAFVELHSRFEYGYVSHALCAAIRSLLKEYLILIAQLENQFRSSPEFTLQKLWYYIQPTMQTLSALDVLVGVIREAGKKKTPTDEVIREADKNKTPSDEVKALMSKKEGIPPESKGGSILTIIAGDMSNMSGDPVTKKLYGFLLNKASVPYIAMLESWIHKGEIRDRDPYEEFMIVESRKVSKESIKEDFTDAYWEQRYKIRDNCVPSFLIPFKEKILMAGKYLNVIRECGIHLSSLGAEQNQGMADSLGSATTSYMERNDVLAALSGGKLVDTIDAAYQYANKKLLDLLLKDKQLLGRLRSMKRYFFLDQSDYFTHFLDLASAELKRPWRDVSLTKLQSLLDLVLRNPSTITVNDVFKEDLKVDMSHLSLVDQLLRIISIKGEEEKEGGAQGQGLTTGDPGEPKGSMRLKDLRTRTHSRASSGDVHLQQGSNDSWQDEMAASGMAASSMEGIMLTSTELPTQTKGSLLGIDALTLDYSVRFPLSLVISRKALTKYQLLFRHLLYLKHGEQVLCNTWIEHAKSPVWKNASVEMKRWRGRVYALRAKMLTFVQQFAYYVCSEVLEPNWRDLTSKLAKVPTVDDVLKIHSDFLDTCLNQCMLTNSKLLRVMMFAYALYFVVVVLDLDINSNILAMYLIQVYSKLMSTCIKFTNYTDRFARALSAMERIETQSGSGLVATAPAIQVQQIEQAMRRLNEFEDVFVYHLKLLIDALNFYSATETVQFLCLVVRLDYNQFYANQTSEGPAAAPQQ